MRKVEKREESSCGICRRAVRSMNPARIAGIARVLVLAGAAVLPMLLSGCSAEHDTGKKTGTFAVTEADAGAAAGNGADADAGAAVGTGATAGAGISAAPAGREMAGAEDGTEKRALITVGFSQLGEESDWRIACTESFQKTFTEENGYYLLFDDAQQKQENQLKAIRNFVLQDVDYIVLAPIVESGWDSALTEAKNAGIPVILSDRTIETDESLYTCFVGADFQKEGVRACEWLEEYLKKQGRDDEEINIVQLEGTVGSSPAIGRTEGFQEVLQKHDNWNLLASESGEFTLGKGEEVMEEYLREFPDIDVLISQNDNMTFGAIDAIERAGRTCGPDGEIIVISYDAVSAAFDEMINGRINADIECNPLHGPRVDRIIRELESGESVEKMQYVDETYFDTSMDLESIRAGRTY